MNGGTSTHEFASPINCTGCGYRFDASTGLPGTEGGPDEGSVSICLACGALGFYTFVDGKLTVRPVTPAEHDELILDEDIRRALAVRSRVVAEAPGKHATAREGRKETPDDKVARHPRGDVDAVVSAAVGETTHACPADGAAVTPCCGRSPFELPMTDRMTLDPALVTCPLAPPRRVQLRRTKGWRMPENTVNVARPGKWGNPYPVAVVGRERAIDLYRDELRGFFTPKKLADLAEEDFRHVYGARTAWRKRGVTSHDVRRELAGKNLACWCPLDQPCHADVLLELANRAATS